MLKSNHRRFGQPCIEPKPWFIGRRTVGRRGIRAWAGIWRVVDLVLEWRETARQGRVLAALDEPFLRDIGINRLDVAREVRKPFWRS